ncbi:ATP-dependent zinc metalloprotease FtsH [Ructibacterium gallinarum]|uniref:ATP-dependent zinc metalloprotease FtsH n=1 Tax=Ructibacterium gallinarum TaxID=2779355 RepID=A0A9D5LZN8_9FIRM|nr:ATP-dependent zinc metalloprotease FtsH [Ructibacterium gallinarum]MBE5039555.1 ATP-dependent zinc metalloprotease FtsH [Ructibacterium gallinarum]
MKRYIKGIGFYVLLFLIIIMIFALTSMPGKQSKEIYSDLILKIQQEQVTELSVVDNVATAQLKDGSTISVEVPGYNTLKADAGESMQKQINEGTLKVETPLPYSPPWWLTLLPTVGLLVIFIVFWFMFMQQAGGGGGGRGVMNFGKSKAKVSMDGKTKKTFADVAGADEEKDELKEIVDFLKGPERYRQLGARIPKGVLLVGPPGTGKTLLAKAVAGEAGVPFFSISGSDFVEMFVGVGASRVRDLFENAKKNAPCIIFIDEIDAVGRHRGAGLGGGHDEREQTLNQLLVEMDGFGANEGVIIIAATNRPDILDPALLRPGRFDRQVVVDSPDVKGREAILEVHSKGKPLAKDVDLSVIAKTTVGFSGADLENLMNEAALSAARKNQSEIFMLDLEESIMKVIAGPEKKSRQVPERAKKLTAFHEAGHAVVSKMLPTQDRVHQVSIIPRGRAGGYTLSLPKEDTFYHSKTEMLEEIVVLLGGRVAEQLVLSDISTGASNDIERATSLAKSMVTRYGMSEKLGARTFGDQNNEVFIGLDYGHTVDYSQETAALIDEEIKRIIDECYERCTQILTEHMDHLHKVAELLLEKEKIEGDEFDAIFASQNPEAVDAALDVVADLPNNGKTLQTQEQTLQSEGEGTDSDFDSNSTQS